MGQTQTAVEWLIEKYQEKIRNGIPFGELEQLFEQAKQMEREQVLGHIEEEYLMLAVEFGYKQCEKGNNLERAIVEFKKLNK